MIDLTAPYVTKLESSTKSWPKCGPCSSRLKRWYPVETLGYVGREQARELHEKYRMVLEAECHGERQTFALNVPDWYSDGKIVELMSHAVLFKRGGIGRVFVVDYRTTRGMTWSGR